MNLIWWELKLEKVSLDNKKKELYAPFQHENAIAIYRVLQILYTKYIYANFYPI